jgi:hypothetical protein
MKQAVINKRLTPNGCTPQHYQPETVAQYLYHLDSNKKKKETIPQQASG